MRQCWQSGQCIGLFGFLLGGIHLRLRGGCVGQLGLCRVVDAAAHGAGRTLGQRLRQQSGLCVQKGFVQRIPPGMGLLLGFGGSAVGILRTVGLFVPAAGQAASRWFRVVRAVLRCASSFSRFCKASSRVGASSSAVSSFSAAASAVSSAASWVRFALALAAASWAASRAACC